MTAVVAAAVVASPVVAAAVGNGVNVGARRHEGGVRRRRQRPQVPVVVQARFEPGPGEGFRRWAMVGEDSPAVHTGFGVCELDPGGTVPAHTHSYEEAFFVLDGSVLLRTPDGGHALDGRARRTVTCYASGTTRDAKLKVR